MPPHPTFASDADLEAIANGLIDRTLPKRLWTHAGHFAAATWIIARRPDLDAARDMPGLIKAYNVSVGGLNTDTAGYHETITQASLRAARAFLAGCQEVRLHVACNRLLASPLGEPDWLLAHWSRECLFSRAARLAWVEPDVKSLPF